MKKRKKAIISILVVLLLLVGGVFLFLWYRNNEIRKQQQKEAQEERAKLQEKIEKAYAPLVKIGKESAIYQKEKKGYKEIGKVQIGMEFELEEEKITSDTKYFHVKGYDFYIPYDAVQKIDALTNDARYQKYLPQEEVTIKKGTTLTQEGKITFTLKEDTKAKVYRNVGTIRYVDYQNLLYPVEESQVQEVTPLDVSSSTQSIPVLVYHFIYLNGDPSCQESICFSEDQVRSHFSYLRDTGAFTLTTEELKEFIKGEIELPQKSVLITIDDGARAEKFIPFLEEYQIHATLFLITSWYDVGPFQSKYLELASHGHDLHNPGVCPGGQGGGIKCLDEAKLQEDFRLTREELGGTTAFCYPFYEYNDYAIEQLKKGGFEMAFMGGMRKVTKGTDLFRIPRISLNSTTTQDEVRRYVEG